MWFLFTCDQKLTGQFSPRTWQTKRYRNGKN